MIAHLPLFAFRHGETEWNAPSLLLRSLPNFAGAANVGNTVLLTQHFSFLLKRRRYWHHHCASKNPVHLFVLSHFINSRSPLGCRSGKVTM
ncbi:hypothetical protein RUM8411_01455 [Ruegeria meonggei]|uniref:Uncharacterized protein n=1 Tax=Ruegeria meonggei TaxID=1446476 RepID=A0A1X6YX79_9RHOB|nr:hypothetical protein RUM8411_01455 [Ruegeria meonggei]